MNKNEAVKKSKEGFGLSAFLGNLAFDQALELEVAAWPAGEWLQSAGTAGIHRPKKQHFSAS